LSLGDKDSPLQGVLRHMENLGSEVFAQVEVPGIEERLTVRFDPRHGRTLAVDDAISLALDPSQALAFDRAGKRVTIAGVDAMPEKVVVNG